MMAQLSVTGFAPEVGEAIYEVADHLNGHHDDTMRLIALGGGAGRDTLGAEISQVDPVGVELTVQLPDRPADRLRVTFSEPRHDMDGVRGEVFALIARSRHQVGRSVPRTTLETELDTTGQLPTFVTTVAAVERLTAGLVEVTLRGGLDAFRPISPDQFVYLITAMPGGRPVEPGFTMAQHQQGDADDRGPAAYYTVRRWRPEVAEMDVWMVLHPHDGTVAQWAAEAVPGDRVAVWGPRSSYIPADGTTHLLLVGDETALPAICAVLEQRPPGWPATVVLETADSAHTVELPRSGDVEVTWAFRGGDAPGTGSRLLDTVAALDVEPRGVYAFGAAETRQIAAVRHHLRHARGIPAAQVRMTGYWRRTTTAHR